MSTFFSVGDRVHVVSYGTLPAFDGVIEEMIHIDGFNVRDKQGRLWFRSGNEMTHLVDMKPEAAE